MVSTLSSLLLPLISSLSNWAGHHTSGFGTSRIYRALTDSQAPPSLRHHSSSPSPVGRRPQAVPFSPIAPWLSPHRPCPSPPAWASHPASLLLPLPAPFPATPQLPLKPRPLQRSCSKPQDLPPPTRPQTPSPGHPINFPLLRSAPAAAPAIRARPPSSFPPFRPLPSRPPQYPSAPSLYKAARRRELRDRAPNPRPLGTHLGLGRRAPPVPGRLAARPPARRSSTRSAPPRPPLPRALPLPGSGGAGTGA